MSTVSFVLKIWIPVLYQGALISLAKRSITELQASPGCKTTPVRWHTAAVHRSARKKFQENNRAVGKDRRKNVQTKCSIIGQARYILVISLALRYMILKKSCCLRVINKKQALIPFSTPPKKKKKN